MVRLFSPLLFALACNLDTVLLAAGCRLRGARLSPAEALVLAAVTTVITALALALGQRAARLLIPGLSEALGGLVLIGMGLWFLLDWLRRPVREDSVPPASPGPAAWISLAAALGVNNAGAGVAAGVSGVSPFWGGAVNFAVTFLSLGLGHWLGCRAEEGRLLKQWALPASGLLLVVLGAIELLP